MGNPLLDIQVTQGEKLLEKYDLKANDAVLASGKQLEIYDEIIRDYKVTYVAGGAAQNAARGAAYVLPPNSVVYTGCVGDDDRAKQLTEVNEKQGVQSVYDVRKGEQTGACAVVITGHHRSLVTTLHAAEKFDIAHLSTPKVAALIDGAKFFYVGGFFLTHGTASILELAKKSLAANKTFAINLSAPFIPQFFGDNLKQVLPYCDIVIGNETEAASWAAANNIADTDLSNIALAIANLPRAEGTQRPRTVVITHGDKATHLATTGAAEAKVYSVATLADEQIVDTNGAGDMFAGGFIGALVNGKSLDEAVEVGHRLGAMCVGQVGPQLKWPKETIA